MDVPLMYLCDEYKDNFELSSGSEAYVTKSMFLFIDRIEVNYDQFP